MTNIVQVRHIADTTAKRYTFEVPDNISLNKGDIVLTSNKDGKKKMVSVCVTDSEFVTDNVVDMIMSGNKITSEVIGKYELKSFNK